MQQSFIKLHEYFKSYEFFVFLMESSDMGLLQFESYLHLSSSVHNSGSNLKAIMLYTHCFYIPTFLNYIGKLIEISYNL